MCDSCPIAGVVTSHEAYRSWIIFKECKTENGTANTIQAGVQSSAESSSSSNRTHTNQGLGNMYVLLDSLDPHLRPATPDLTDPKSVELYEEHKKVAEEYWKVQTELVLMTQKKNQLIAAEAEEKQRLANLRALQEEKESLMLAKDLLQQQRERSSRQSTNPISRHSGDEWVIIPRGDTENDD